MYHENNKQCPPNTMLYIIKAGDTFYNLAIQYNTTIPALISANPMVNPNNLMIGQPICIPMQPIFPSCPEGNFYTIKAGDTLYSLAKFYNVSLDDLLEANPGIDPDRLFVGQVICIPLAVPPVTCPQGQMEYVIKPGDTFFGISQKYNIPLQDIINANPGVDPNALLVGQVICIPDV